MKKARTTRKQNPWEKYINEATLENVYSDIDIIYRIFEELDTSIKELEIPRSLGLLSDGLDHIEDINYNTLSKFREIYVTDCENIYVLDNNEWVEVDPMVFTTDINLK